MQNSRPSLSARFTSTQGSCLITLICLQILWSFVKLSTKMRKISTKHLKSPQKISTNPALTLKTPQIPQIFVELLGFCGFFQKITEMIGVLTKIFFIIYYIYYYISFYLFISLLICLHLIFYFTTHIKK